MQGIRRFFVPSATVNSDNDNAKSNSANEIRSESEENVVESSVDVPSTSRHGFTHTDCSTKESEKMDSYNKKVSTAEPSLSAVSNSAINTAKHQSVNTLDGSVTKKIRTGQKFRKEYTLEWPCLIKSSKSDQHVFCTVCSRDISINHAGRDDCRRHTLSKVHVDLTNIRSSNSSLLSYGMKHDEEDSVTNAEMLFSSFIVEHSLPISCADHTSQLFKKMFPDSQIAKNYSCGRTKTTAMINSLSTGTQSEIITHLKVNPFSLATDGSTDIKDVKLYPIVITYFDVKQEKICTTILSLLESNLNTGEGIFNLLSDELLRKGIPWKNCISFACDNANTMVGHVKGVAAFLKKVQPHIRIQTCSCHLLHLAAQRGVKSFKYFDPEEFVMGIYYFLQKSSKRQSTFKLCQNIYGTKPHKILKYVCTRWLSLLQSIERIVEQWEPLVEFFNEEASKNIKNCHLSTVQPLLNDPATKLYLLFLCNTLSVFTKTNVFLQKEEPVIHKLHGILNGLFAELIIRFIKPSAVPGSGCLLELKFNKNKYHKGDEDIVIGADTRSYIRHTKLEKSVMVKFYEDIRLFFVNSCSYMKQKFPLDDDFLQNMEVIDIKSRKNKSFGSVVTLSELLPDVLNEYEKKSLELEFSMYQFDDFQTVEEERADIAWCKISALCDASGIRKYPSLSKLMLALLLVPHSNAACERIFSIVRRNVTEFRSSLNTTTLSSLLISKINHLSSERACYQNTFTKDQIRTAKSATRLSLKRKPSTVTNENTDFMLQ